MEVIWTKLAIRRVISIVNDIAQDNFQAAYKWSELIFERTDQLIEHPESGRIVPEYNHPDLREIIEGNYRITYRIRKQKRVVYITTVLHVRQKPPQSGKLLR